MANPKTEESDPGEIAAAIALWMHDDLARIQARLSARYRRILREALDELRARLTRFEGGAWNAARMRASMAMIAAGLSQMTETTLAQLTRDLGLTSLRSQQAVARYLATLDRTFTGVARPLRFDSLAWWEETHKNIGRVRIRQYTRSMQRYGATITAQIEDELAKTVLLGERWDEARPKIWAAVEKIVGDRQWMVDRIIQTESSAAWNATALAALMEEDEPDDRMKKKLVATFDDVTGRDSVKLHGQTRLVDKPFFDSVNNITYMAPPNRPHDREILVPWRDSYGEEFEDYTAETAIGYDPDVHGKRKRLEKPKKRPPASAGRRRAPEDPDRPSPKTKAKQLESLRAQRKTVVKNLRTARERTSALQRIADTQPEKMTAAMREQLATQAAIRTSLRKQTEEFSSWIDQLERM